LTKFNAKPPEMLNLPKEFSGYVPPSIFLEQGTVTFSAFSE